MRFSSSLDDGDDGVFIAVTSVPTAVSAVVVVVVAVAIIHDAGGNNCGTGRWRRGGVVLLSLYSSFVKSVNIVCKQ